MVFLVHICDVQATIRTVLQLYGEDVKRFRFHTECGRIQESFGADCQICQNMIQAFHMTPFG
ncbi:hypothetical protein WL67_20805 [Burkholderia ubonensis]|nr:hypothetical protein WL67_20805 [Burkholderia ubonensis]KWD60461.1 hypothetical protein WL66_05385 [Burkholderia ubonensis]